MSFYRQFIHHGELCFDIGANRGHWSEVFLSLGASVIAVEPQSTCFEALFRKFKNNSSIRILQYGVGSKEEVKELRVADNLINSTFSDEFIEKYKHNQYTQWTSKENVQVTTLDKLISQYGVPRFCKIDVEGFELNVFKGLSQPIHFIQFEYVPPFRAQVIECLDLLSKLGNPIFNYYSYENMKLELKQWVNVEAIKKIVLGFPEDFLVADILVNYTAV